MTLSSAFSFFLLLIGCTLVDDPAPINKDAPELDFSKPQWVNEFQYDGVFTINRALPDENIKITRFACTYKFYFNSTQKFNPINENTAIENGFWIDDNAAKVFYKYTVNSDYYGEVLLNDARFNRSSYGRFNFTLPNSDPWIETNLKYDLEKGPIWKIEDYILKEKSTSEDIYQLYPADKSYNLLKPTFIHEKSDINSFPDAVKLKPTYTVSNDEKSVTINFDKIRNADVIYFKFNAAGSKVPDLNSDYTTSSNGFIKYLKGDETSLTVKLSDLVRYTSSVNEISINVTAIKFYSSTENYRKFLFKNTATSNSIIKVGE
jgi:hypothetical protein